MRKLEMSKLWCTFLANSHQSRHFGNNEAISEHCQKVICTAVCGDETFTVHLFRSCPRLSKTWIVNEVMARIDCARAHFGISKCRPTIKQAFNIDQFFQVYPFYYHAKLIWSNSQTLFIKKWKSSTEILKKVPFLVPISFWKLIDCQKFPNFMWKSQSWQHWLTPSHYLSWSDPCAYTSTAARGATRSTSSIWENQRMMMID